MIQDVFATRTSAELLVSGDEGWDTIDEYVRYVAPHLADRINHAGSDPSGRDDDVFRAFTASDERLAEALERRCGCRGERRII